MQSVQQTVSCDSFQLQVVSTWWLEETLSSHKYILAGILHINVNKL